MGITIADPDDIEDDDETEGERQLSDNVLVIEISGPDVHGLSVIDFPGFLHSMSHSHRSTADLVLICIPDSAQHDVFEIEAIRGLVMDYINDPHSIIM